MSIILNREAILAAGKNFATDEVAVPEWGGSIKIRELSADKAIELGALVSKDEKQAMVLWVIAAVVDEAGNAVFTEADCSALGAMPAGPILKIGKAAIKLSNLANVEETAKNSVASLN